jgi:hypothetical protein
VPSGRHDAAEHGEHREHREPMRRPRARRTDMYCFSTSLGRPKRVRLGRTVLGQAAIRTGRRRHWRPCRQAEMTLALLLAVVFVLPRGRNAETQLRRARRRRVRSIIVLQSSRLAVRVSGRIQSCRTGHCELSKAQPRHQVWCPPGGWRAPTRPVRTPPQVWLWVRRIIDRLFGTWSGAVVWSWQRPADCERKLLEPMRR